jgi:hypothetical protein
LKLCKRMQKPQSHRGTRSTEKFSFKESQRNRQHERFALKN